MKPKHHKWFSNANFPEKYEQITFDSSSKWRERISTISIVPCATSNVKTNRVSRVTLKKNIWKICSNLFAHTAKRNTKGRNIWENVKKIVKSKKASKLSILEILWNSLWMSLTNLMIRIVVSPVFRIIHSVTTWKSTIKKRQLWKNFVKSTLCFSKSVDLTEKCWFFRKSRVRVFSYFSTMWVWNFQDFSVIQILREINFWIFEVVKLLAFFILGALNLGNLLFFSLRKVQRFIFITIQNL